jgi:hypothetical protein
MKASLISLAVGLGVGVISGIWIHAKKLNVSHVASVCLVGERYDRQQQVQVR